MDIESEKERLERAKIERELKRLDAIESRNTSYRTYSPYKSISLGASLFLLIACFGILAWLAGRKSGKDKCER